MLLRCITCEEYKRNNTLFSIDYIKSYLTRLAAVLPAFASLWLFAPPAAIVEFQSVAMFCQTQIYLVLAAMLVVCISTFTSKLPSSQLHFARKYTLHLVTFNLLLVVLFTPYLIFTINDIAFFTLTNTSSLLGVPALSFAVMIAQYIILNEGLRKLSDYSSLNLDS